MNPRLAVTLATLCSLPLLHCALPAQGMRAARGALAGHAMTTHVDSDLARYYLETWLAGERLDPSLDERIATLEARYADVPGEAALAALSEETSVDFATLLFASRLEQKNATLHRQLAHQLRRVRAANGTPKLRARETAPLVLFAPGWFYESHPEHGGDFASQRARFTVLGIDNRLIPLDEGGSIEDNARVIARAVRDARPRQVAIVSASKSSPEVALALGSLLSDEESAHVTTWLNIGGVIGGSPLADGACAAPKSVGVSAIFWWNGWDIEGLGGMRPARARARMARLALPEKLRVVNFLPVPLSGQITPDAQDGYDALAPRGPNDGLVLLSDALVPGAETLLAPGVDHYLRSADMDDRAVALYLTLFANERATAQ